ncbi:MAG: hypothetical protein WCE44_00060 [Candidatus Velthaea sp.]
MPVRHLAFVLAVVLLGASPAPADPPGADRPHPAHLDGVVHDVDFGTGVVTLESAGRSFAVTVPGTTPIKEGTATRSIIDFKAGVTRLHIEGSALGRHVTAASIEIKV